MKKKTKNNKNQPKEIDNQANIRAGGFHEDFDNDFDQTQVPNSPKKEDFKKHQQENSKGVTNKNYGWKQGFDHSETYGSELKKNSEKKPKK